MIALKAIGWFILMLFSIVFMFQFIGYAGLTSMFPEGKRWYHLPLQLGSIAFYTIVVMHHPF